MIGLYAQNENTQKQLALLLKSLGVETYVPDNSYTSLIWLSNTPAPKGNSILPTDALPLTLSEWRHLIQQYSTQSVQYKNSFFLFEASRRLLTHLPTQNTISLTEKESDFLAFLTTTTNHQATKEELLQHVWQYSPEAETHTLESHLYALRQKIGQDADHLVCIRDGIFCLV